ncbi:MAG: helix-turn-helix transcriptional regulator [Novosphingobium sp.]|jgi:transcriptional regulator with XRE-family HTH domain
MRTVARCTDEKVRQTIAIPDRQLGQRLRRFRRLRGLKQEHVAQILGVSQGLISRWEAGKHVPSPEISHQIRRFISVAPDSVSDRALRRLVEAANVPVHLICDATHRLLAASPLREDEWRASAHAFIGSSLWRFATDDIVLAEDRLADHGWFDRPDPDRISIPTKGNGSNEMRILPSTLEWERVGLADGRVGRLVTTVAFV